MAFTQMFQRQLNIVAGYFGRGMLVKVLPVASGSENKAYAGRCGHINANGQWAAGPVTGRKGPAMFIFRGVNQPDVTNDGYSGISGLYWWVSGNAQGFVTCIPATGGFELQTTEFDTSQTYNNGDPLTVTNEGILTNFGATPFSTFVVGFCAPFTAYPENMRPAAGSAIGPVGTNAHGVRVLNFYTAFYPTSS